MSRESMTTLNQNVLVGYAGARGNAWHYDRAYQGDESNHYDGAVPVEDVKRRLFDWQISSSPEWREAVGDGLASPDVWTATRLTPDGVETRQLTMSDDVQVLSRSDRGSRLGSHSAGYQPHDYGQWLLDNVANLLDDYINIGSAGLLKGSRQAWVSVEMPDNITTASGIKIRPRLLSFTSSDGSLSTGHKLVSTIVVCDNTFNAARREDGAVVRFRHSSRSLKNITKARDALDLVVATGEDYSAEIDRLVDTTVTDKQWASFLDAHEPIPEDTGKNKGAITRAENRRDQLVNLWTNDMRVAPWRNTAWGVVQAVNTFAHHVQTVQKGDSRYERNAERAITTAIDKLDADTLAKINQVLAGNSVLVAA